MHLKLNYDTNAALTQIQAKVAQVRNDLPPEAEAPVIDLQTADNQFAAMYIGFSSADLDQNQITDYLTRVVQPKLSAISGVQRADILGDRTFAMRIWLKPDKMAALGISASAVHDALAQEQLPSALGSTKGSMVSVNLVANTDLRTAEEFRQLVVKNDNGVVVRLGEIADVVLGAQNYDSEVRFNGETATFMGIWVLPTANSLEVIKRVREAIPGIQAAVAYGDESRHSLRLNGVHPGRHQRSAAHPDRDPAHRYRGHFPVSRVDALGAHPGRGHSDFAHWRRLPDARIRLHHQPADPAGHRALGRTGGG